MNTTLGKRIAALRHQKELKQDELAEKLGITAQAVSKWENDQTCPDIFLLPNLAKILGVSIDELLTGKTEEVATVKMFNENEKKEIKDMILRIVTESRNGDVARVNLPLGIVDVLIEGGMNMAQVSGNDALKSIDLNRIMNMVRQGVYGNLVECDSRDGDTVRIFVE